LNDNQLDKYKWISFIDKLCNGDWTKEEQVYRMNYINSLNILSFYYHRDKAIEEQQRLANK
jgi:hypothetical protein